MINATDDKALADELWGDGHHWDDELRQYVPEGGKLCPGTNSSASTDSNRKPSDKSRSADDSHARTTASRTGRDHTASSGARSTGTGRD